MNKSAELIAQPATYWYFIADLILSACREFNINTANLSNQFIQTGLDEDTAQELAKIFKTNSDIEILAGQVFANIPYRQETRTVEVVIHLIMTSNDYSHSTPDSRAKMGKKMFNLVTTNLLNEEEKVHYIEMIGNNMIQHLINED